MVLALLRRGVGRAELQLLPIRQLAEQLLGRLPRVRQVSDQSKLTCRRMLLSFNWEHEQLNAPSQCF